MLFCTFTLFDSPGSSLNKENHESSIQWIAECINKAHQETECVMTVLENMAGQGTVLGSTFEELHEIISLVDNKSRVGVCLDTCHLFAAGYDISTKESFDAVLKEFDEIVGLDYLKAMHLNDSKGELGSHKDRHENIGKGKIGMDAFQFIMNDPRFNDIPMILETPIGKENDVEIWKQEIETLYNLQNLQI